MSEWLSDSTANRYRQSYVKEFLDVSGNMYVRNGDLDISGGDTTISGNVGIGTTSPTSSLHIHDNTLPVIRLSRDDDSHNGFQLYSTSTAAYVSMKENRPMYFETNLSTKMTITSDGNVGIGTDNPAFKLDIKNSDNTYLQTSQGTVTTDVYGANWRYGKSNNTYQYWDVGLHGNDRFHFRWSGVERAFVREDSTVGQLTFTGQHRNFIENIPASKTSNYIGLIVSANKNEYFHIDKEAKRGNEAITINDAVPLVTICSIEKDKTVFGVISDAEEINTDGGRTHASGQFVSVVEKQTGDNRTFINSLGEGAIWVSNKNGNLESGDYITGSSVPGYGQKQESEFLANYTVGKITMDCDFNPQLQYKKRVIKQDIVFNGPDASGNYYDVSNNVLIYTDTTNIYKNTKYNLTFDASNNLISVTQNVLDANEEIQWEDTEEQERAYNIRYLDASANILTEEEYNTKIAASEEAYIAAFVGCTYHCG